MRPLICYFRDPLRRAIPSFQIRNSQSDKRTIYLRFYITPSFLVKGKSQRYAHAICPFIRILQHEELSCQGFSDGLRKPPNYACNFTLLQTSLSRANRIHINARKILSGTKARWDIFSMFTYKFTTDRRICQVRVSTLAPSGNPLWLPKTRAGTGACPYKGPQGWL